MQVPQAPTVESSEDRENTFFIYTENGCEEADVDVVRSTSTRPIVLPLSNRLVIFAMSALGAALFVACLVFIPSRGPLWATVKESTELNDLWRYCNGPCPAVFANPDSVQTGASVFRATDEQVSVYAPATGTLTFLDVRAGDNVSQGDVLAAVIIGNSIVEIKSPGFSTVKHVRSVRAGDVVNARHSLVVMDKLYGLSNFNLKADEKPILASADGFTGMGVFESWGITGLKTGSYVQKGARLATVLAEVSGGKFTINMPEDGMLTGVHSLEPGAEVNAGGEFAVYKPALAGVEILHGPGLKQLRTASGAVFIRWRVQTFDMLSSGCAIAEFEESDGNSTTVTWDGPSGMLLDKQPLLNGDGLLPGAALITVGQAVFIKHTVKVGDYVRKGYTVAIVQVGLERKPILARKDGMVMSIRPMRFQEPLGFDIELADETFGVLGVHLPRLTPESGNGTETVTNIYAHWLTSLRYSVNRGDKVKKGDVVALAKEVIVTTMLTGAAKAGDSEIKVADTIRLSVGMQVEISDGTSSETRPIISISHLPRLPHGAPGKLTFNSALSQSHASLATVNGLAPKDVMFRADLDGYVAQLQSLKPGAMLGPQDDVFDIDQNGPQLPLWTLILVLLCCSLCALGAFGLATQPQRPSVLSALQRTAERGLAIAVVVCTALTSLFKQQRRPMRVSMDLRPDDESDEPDESNEPQPVAAAPLVVEPEPAPAPAQIPEVVAQPPGVPIYFDNEPYYFEYHPIGISFRHFTSPIRIAGFTFNSYGRTLGLKEGQQLTRIKDVDVREDFHYGQIDSLLCSAVQELPMWPLRIDFQTNSNETKKFYFKQRPLGIRFTQHLPIRIKEFRPHALAQKAGVQVDWKIVRIAEEDTTPEGMARINITTNRAGYEHVENNLLKGIDPLPYWPVSLEFKAPPSREIMTINVLRRPLGIALRRTKQGTFKVDSVEPQSVAEDLGVQVGQNLIRIMGEDVKKDRDAKHVEKELHDMTQHLPQKTPSSRGSYLH